MAEEFLDIVDENNELTGESAPRSRVHREGLWHRTVLIYLFRRNNAEIEFLVHLRASFKDTNPNRWDTRFGGHVKSGLTIEGGVRAELEEEIGLDIDNYKLIEGRWRKRDIMPNREFSKTYFIEYSGDVADLKFNDGEVQEVKWMSVSSVKDSILSEPEKWSASLERFAETADYLWEKINA